MEDNIRVIMLLKFKGYGTMFRMVELNNVDINNLGPDTKKHFYDMWDSMVESSYYYNYKPAYWWLRHQIGDLSDLKQILRASTDYTDYFNIETFAVDSDGFLI